MKKLLSRLRRTVRSLKSTKHGTPLSSDQVDPAQAETKIVCIDPCSNAPLENLPPEVRRHILFSVDFEGLRALTRASPVYHQQFLLDRKPFLRGCLENTLRSVVVEAYFVQQSSSASFSLGRTKDGVTQFLQSYQARRSSPDSILEEMTSDEASKMIAFYTSIVEPLARQYTRWALDNMNSFAGAQHKPQPLSTTEETRLFRALYRFQLCSNLFGLGAHATDLQPYQFRIDGVDILNWFADLFEPWEVEEIFCVVVFAQDKYGQIFDAICWDVNENNPKFDDERPPTPDGAWDLSGSYPRCSHLTAVVSRGLPLLHTVFFQIQTHDHLVSTMQEQIYWPLGDFFNDEIGGALYETTQYRRRDGFPSDRDAKQERRDPLPFEGDCAALVGPDGPWTSLPPLAWTVLWRGAYSNMYGFYVKKEIQRWGYVFWDAKRMEETGTKEALVRWIEAEWGDGDPRDFNFL